MRVMVIVKATSDSERGMSNDASTLELMAAMGRFNEELQAAGVFVTAEGLKPSAEGRRVRFDGADRAVSDGPFGPAEELVAGFWLWDVADMDEAVAWVKRCPNPMREASVIEIRPAYEREDLPA